MFVQADERIKKENLNPNHHYKIAHNFISDLTMEEMDKMRNLMPEKAKSAILEHPPVKEGEVEELKKAVKE